MGERASFFFSFLKVLRVEEKEKEEWATGGGGFWGYFSFIVLSFRSLSLSSQTLTLAYGVVYRST